MLVMTSLEITAQKEGNGRKRTSNQTRTQDLQSIAVLQPQAIGPSHKSFVSHCLMYWSPVCHYPATA